MSDCALHSGLHVPDRAAVREALQAITTEVVDVVVASERPESPLEPIIERRSYDTNPDRFPEAYKKTTNMRAFNDANGSFDTYVTAETTSRFDKPILRQPFIPLGEHGLEFSERLLVGVIRALDLAEARTDEIGEIATKSSENVDAILHHTFQGYVNKDARRSLAITTQIGVISTGQSMALLAAERMPGLDGDELLGKVVESQKLTEFARRIGSGLLPFLVLFGRYISPPLTVTRGGLDLSSRLKVVTRDNWKAFRAVVAEAESSLPNAFELQQQAEASNDVELSAKLKADYEAYHLTASGGTTCPAANRGGEIKKMAELIMGLMPTA